MEVYFQLINDADALKKACDELKTEDVLGFDTETTALDPYEGEIRLVQFSSGKDTKVIDLKPFAKKGDVRTLPELEPLRELIAADKPIKIAHNAKFDAKWVKHHLGAEIGGVFDTLLASQLIAAGDKDRRHNLAAVSEFFLNIEVDKSEQISDWSAEELSHAQIQYAAKDAAIMVALREKIIERLKADNLIRAAKIEFDCVMPIAQMELNGFYLDEERWREQLDKVEKEQKVVGLELQKMLSAGVAQASLFGIAEINLNSQAQVTDALKNLGVPVPATTRGWQLQPLAEEFPVVAKLLEYRGVAKSLTSFGENILDFIKPETGRIHADFRQIGAPTGRFSCVAEGALVDIPGGRIPIEKIKIGDFVYCYKENGELTLRKVLNVWDNGIKDCVEIKWQSSGDGSTGSVIVTPEHKIRTKYKGWQEARNLKRYDKLFHLRKSVIKKANEKFRVRLYGTNKYMELEEQLIKREYFQAKSSMHIHHKNENKLDNRIKNLEVLSASEHTSLHSSDPEHIAIVKLNLEKAWANRPTPKYEEESPLWKSVSRLGLMKMLAKAKGRPTYVEMDFETFKRKCRKADLKIKKVQSRYGANGIYLKDKNILAALAESPNTCIAAKKLGIGTRKLKAICQERGLTYNHAVTSVKKVGKRRVYDLEVEGEHNFIANEICVHNCSKPNIQQIPHEEEYRRCFRAPDGKKLITADYSQVELRILAQFSNDENFIKAFQTGEDFHTTAAAQVFNVKPEEVTPEQRSFAKRLNFGVVYGIGSQRFALMTGVSNTEAENIMRRYFATYRGLDAWLRDAARKVLTEGVAKTASGRIMRFRIDESDRRAVSLAQRNGKNMPIQGCVGGNTRIFEKTRGYISIEKLAGQKVSVWDGERFAKAKVAYSGTKQLVKVEFWGGHFIECSPDHKFLTIDVNGRKTWRKPAEFVKGCYVVLAEGIEKWDCPTNLPAFEAGKAHNASRASLKNMIDSPKELGEWLGRLASDGSTTNHQMYLLIAEHEKEILPKIRSYCEAFGHVGETIKTGGHGTQPIYFLTISAKGLAKQIQDSGIKYKIPDFVWQNNRILAGYLRGMFDGDGTVNRDGAVLTFGKGGDFYIDWAREVQEALLLFGIRGRINRCADRINVCILKRDMPVFCKHIGFINSQKQEKAEKIYSNQHQNKIYGRAVRIKTVETTNEWIDMYDVVDSETSKFAANGLVTHNSSADILKRALRLFHDSVNSTSARLVNIVHDEIIVEADASEAEETAKKLEKAMCDAGEEYISKVPVKVDVKISDEWSK